MQTLQILSDDGTPVVSIRIQDVDPAAATVACIQALATLPKPPTPRKTRSNAGKPKTKASQHAESADAAE